MWTLGYEMGAGEGGDSGGVGGRVDLIKNLNRKNLA